MPDSSRGEPTDPQPRRLTELPSWLITQTATLTNRLVAAALTEVGGTRYDYALLAALEEFGPASQAQLGRRCRIDRSDIVATVDRLAGNGYVDRQRDPDNGRQNVITLSPAGRRRLLELTATLDRVQADLLGDLPAARRRDLVTTLERILQRHQGLGD